MKHLPLDTGVKGLFVFFSGSSIERGERDFDIVGPYCHALTPCTLKDDQNNHEKTQISDIPVPGVQRSGSLNGHCRRRSRERAGGTALLRPPLRRCILRTGLGLLQCPFRFLLCRLLLPGGGSRDDHRLGIETGC